MYPRSIHSKMRKIEVSALVWRLPQDQRRHSAEPTLQKGMDQTTGLAGCKFLEGTAQGQTRRESIQGPTKLLAGRMGQIHRTSRSQGSKELSTLCWTLSFLQGPRNSGKISSHSSEMQISDRHSYMETLAQRISSSTPPRSD